MCLFVIILQLQVLQYYSAANCVLNVSDAKFVNNLVVIGDHTYDLYKCLGTVYLGSKSEGYFNNVSLYV